MLTSEDHSSVLFRLGQSGPPLFGSEMTVQKGTARYSVQNETARPFKNIQNGKIVGENEQHVWEQWAVRPFLFWESPGIFSA